MRRFDMRIVGGILLIAAGVLFLLQNLGLVTVGAYVWPILLGVAGLTFLAVFVLDRASWWALIPGFTLLGLAALIALGSVLSETMENLGVAIFLGAIGLGFWVVYLFNRAQWWAIIPGGVLLTTAATVGFSADVEDEILGGIFLLGLCLTFGLVYLLPNPHGRMRWALVPAVVLGLFGLLLIAALGPWLNLIEGVLLILAGLFLVVRSFRRRK